MTTTEIPFLHQVRLARCEALAKELATLRAKSPMTLGSDRQVYELACKAVEADLVQAAGTPEQRAIEAAQDQLGDQLAEALIALATSTTAGGGQPLATRLEAVEILRTKFLWLRFPEQSDYTSEAEETLTRLRSLAAALHTDSELKSLTGAEVLGRFMSALSVP